MSEVKVLIVDKYTLLREALKAVLASEKDISIVGETFSAEEAARILREKAPDIAFLNFLKFNPANVRLIKKARELSPSTRFIGFVNGNATEATQAYFNKDVSGLLKIDSDPSELKEALRTVLEGEPYIDGRVKEALFSEPEQSFDGAVPVKLSSRQLQILRMIARGFTNKRISAELGISEDTVKTHIRMLLKKLDASDRAHAVSKAYEVGILPVREG